MADYSKWTKDDLVGRIKQLENELKSRSGGLQPSSSEKHHDVEIASLPGEPAKKKAKKKGKGMDPTKYSQRFVALKLAYLGKNYNGFEYQPTGVMSTIEEELWKALVKACLIFPDPERPNEVDWTCCEYSKCGRTDRGVSAFGQVVALRVRSNKPVKGKRKPQAAAAGQTGSDDVQMGGTPAAEEASLEGEGEKQEQKQEDGDDNETPLPVDQEIQYCRVLNRILPPDIKIYAWCPSPPPDFSARFSCRERQYRYFFTQPAFAPLPNSLEANHNSSKNNAKSASSSRRPKDGWLNIDAMRKAAKMFEGVHDFRNFCKVDPSKQITNFVRRIFESDIVEVDGINTAVPYLDSPQFRDPTAAAGVAHPKVYYFHVRGSAFLWHQIRCMVAVLFLVGQGLEDPGVVAELLDPERHPRRPNYVLADDRPLVLWDCIFGRENGEGAADEVDWVYVGADNPLSLLGTGGVANDLWEYWREKKMDEILSNRLLDWVATKTGVERVTEAQSQVLQKTKMGASTRVYEGGNGPRFVGAYVPLLKKDKLQSPDDLNDRWAQRKGFKNAEEMRGVGNWRDAIKEMKNGADESVGNE
ncbi:trna-pseudouridine synthase [Diaporthe amygdali]|uniref:trna-pseudouridine synthase n=1 Tax=Phomopsis amygdali TaxID=1214568 RepID=UPI0022FE2D44|nr:trna-pseudouridine synthase [Diaporthe amygdali]KAJ0125446.1 trna-pseudouridine synthase [Diaporthe amygdali]